MCFRHHYIGNWIKKKQRHYYRIKQSLHSERIIASVTSCAKRVLSAPRKVNRIEAPVWNDGGGGRRRDQGTTGSAGEMVSLTLRGVLTQVNSQKQQALA